MVQVIAFSPAILTVKSSMALKITTSSHKTEDFKSHLQAAALGELTCLFVCLPVCVSVCESVSVSV